MAVVETERKGQVLVVRMNRPERLNALNNEMRQKLAETWNEFRHSKELEVAIFTGTGRGFCAGEDMKETLETGKPGGTKVPDPFMDGTLEKPVIAAVNGFAMGGGFMLVERTDLRVAVPEAVFRCRRPSAGCWGPNHGHLAIALPDRHGDGAGLRFTAGGSTRSASSARARAGDPGRHGHGRASAFAAAGRAGQHGAHDASDAPRADWCPQGTGG
jgi:enoyl-CoA hydratase/carnithine racemase